MGSAQRILKNLLAMFAGRLISIIQQVILPPVFIWRYGASGFGEWSVLYGAVGALALLNFGVQTYMNQDLAVRYQRGEVEGYRVRQATAVRLLLLVIGCVSVLLLVVFVLPVDSLEKLHISRLNAQWTAYLLAVYVLFTILFGYLSGIFMGVALAHRGAHWNNVQALLTATGLLVGVALHLPFVALAAIVLGMLLLSIVGVLLDLRRTAPALMPSLDAWQPALLKDILRGSGYFALIECSTFLTYALPLTILQLKVGPVAVAGFILMRTIFSMCRQVLSMFTQSMGAEITNLFGRRDWPALARLYNYSERMIFFLIALVNLTVLMLSPVLITLWVQRKGAGHGLAHGTVSQLFAVYPYVLASAISIVISLKEHKFQFQFSTNTHVELARVMFFSYMAMDVVAVGATSVAGVTGFLWTWLAAELLQTVRLVSLNSRLFAHVERLDTVYITRLAVVGFVGLLGGFLALERTSLLPLWEQAVVAAGAGLLVGGATWQVFGVRLVASEMLGRFRRRFA